MPHLRLRHLALLAAVALSAACASTSGQSSAASGSKITPPELLRGGAMPETREVLDLRIEVLVHADGQPDMKTLKVTGKGAGSSRAAIEDWIQASTFKPAMQDGHPVAAVFRTGIKTRIEVRRM